MNKIEVWIENTIENENLKRALRLRMNQNFPEALQYLNLACVQNDGKALFFKYRAYKYGGWTLYQDSSKAESYWKQAILANCPWVTNGDAYGMGMHYLIRTKKNKIYKVSDAIPDIKKAFEEGHPLAAVELFWLNHPKESFKCLFHSALFGDEETQYRLGIHIKLRIRNDHDRSEPWLLKAANAKHQNAIEELSETYFEDPTKTLECAYWLMERREISNLLRKRLANSSKLRELFIFGRGFILHKDKFVWWYDLFKESVYLYQQSTSKTKEALDCFTIICKRRNLLCKNLRRIIGEIIWKSREDPKIWGVSRF